MDAIELNELLQDIDKMLPLSKGQRKSTLSRWRNAIADYLVDGVAITVPHGKPLWYIRQSCFAVRFLDRS